MTTDTDTTRAREQAKSQLENIVEMVKALVEDNGGEPHFNTDEERDAKVAVIQEHPLSVQVRSGWHLVGEMLEAGEYEILLCTGGPAVRIVGGLFWNDPDSVRLECQDWFTEWAAYPLTGEERQAVLTYAKQFYYGA